VLSLQNKSPPTWLSSNEDSSNYGMKHSY